MRPGSHRFIQPLSEGDGAGQPRVPDHNHPFDITVAGSAPSSSGAADGGVSSGALPSLASRPFDPKIEADPTTHAALERSIAFPDPDHSRSEQWTLAWEDVLPGTKRTLGHAASGTLTDAGGAFCSRGVLAGDKVLLTGCDTDADCDFQLTCLRDPAAPLDVTRGMCLHRDARQAHELDACGPLLRGVKLYRITSAKQGATGLAGEITDRLDLAEIYEPEHPASTHACAVDDDCKDVTLTAGNAATTPLPTSCLADVDGAHRCLRACRPEGTAAERGCGVDFQCVAARGTGDFRCMRAPLDDTLFATCFPELTPYEVHVGEAFLVSGAQTGVLTDLEPDPMTRECRVPPSTASTAQFARQHASRVPMIPANRCAGGDLLDALPVSSNPANVCLFDDSNGRVIHFENPFFVIGVKVPAVPPDQTLLKFSIVGGGFPLIVTLGVDVQAQQPRAAVTGPDGQTVFVVDEGKQSTATGLRGQLLRLFSLTQSIDRTFLVR
jgi:hypothetical protein